MESRNSEGVSFASLLGPPLPTRGICVASERFFIAFVVAAFDIAFTRTIRGTLQLSVVGRD